MNLREFSKINKKRCESPKGFNHQVSSWSLSDWMTATTGELGEAANVVKELNRFRDGVPGNKETEAVLRAKLRGEIADTLIYLDLMAQSAGFDLSDAVTETFNAKSRELGCPILFGQSESQFDVGDLVRVKHPNGSAGQITNVQRAPHKLVVEFVAGINVDGEAITWLHPVSEFEIEH